MALEKPEKFREFLLLLCGHPVCIYILCCCWVVVKVASAAEDISDISVTPRLIVLGEYELSNE